MTATGFVSLRTPKCNISMLYGYSMPVLLRSELDYYTFVSSAYVHRIMHGSVMPEEVTDERVVEFNIR